MSTAPWITRRNAESLFVPLPMRDLALTLRQHGLPEAVILELLNQFGAGVSEREDKVGR